METWPPSVLWEGVEERLSPALEVECVTESWGFTSLEFELKNPLLSSSLSPPEYQSAPLYGALLSVTHILFALLLSVSSLVGVPLSGCSDDSAELFMLLLDFTLELGPELRPWPFLSPTPPATF